MKFLQALRNGFRLCHSHFPLLWIETAWRSVAALLYLVFSLLAAFVLVDRATVGPGWQLRKRTGLEIFKLLSGILFASETLLLQVVLLVIAFCLLVWLLLASFFQGSILATLKGTAGEDAAHNSVSDGVYRFVRSGWRFLPSLLSINLLILFFSFTGLAAFVLIVSFFLKPILSAGGGTPRWWLLWSCPLGIVVVCLIIVMALRFLELCKFYVTQYHCSLWVAWNRSAEFFFPNLRSMSAISALIRGLQFVCAAAATVFFFQIAFAVGSRFPGLRLSVALALYFGYGVVRNYLALVQSGSLLALIMRGADD